MANKQNNPYLDQRLMKGLQQYSPTHNKQFLSSHKINKYTNYNSNSNNISVGQEIIFNSDPDDDDESYIYTGTITRYIPQKPTITIKLKSTGVTTSYFIDEIKIKAILSAKKKKKK
eukprot:289197_1